MASADFCKSIPTSRDAGSTRQIRRPPRVRRVTFALMPAAFTSVLSVQVWGVEDSGLLTQHECLICDFCSSSQCFACGFLQPTPRGINLAVRLAVPLAGPAEDFHLQVSPNYHHDNQDCACHGATRHAWRTTRKRPSNCWTALAFKSCEPKKSLTFRDF